VCVRSLHRVHRSAGGVAIEPIRGHRVERGCPQAVGILNRSLRWCYDLPAFDGISKSRRPADAPYVTAPLRTGSGRKVRRQAGTRHYSGAGGVNAIGRTWPILAGFDGSEGTIAMQHGTVRTRGWPLFSPTAPRHRPRASRQLGTRLGPSSQTRGPAVVPIT
jgi:hypothetical protein